MLLLGGGGARRWVTSDRRQAAAAAPTPRLVEMDADNVLASTAANMYEWVGVSTPWVLPLTIPPRPAEGEGGGGTRSGEHGALQGDVAPIAHGVPSSSALSQGVVPHDGADGEHTAGHDPDIGVEKEGPTFAAPSLPPGWRGREDTVRRCSSSSSSPSPAALVTYTACTSSIALAALGDKGTAVGMSFTSGSVKDAEAEEEPWLLWMGPPAGGDGEGTRGNTEVEGGSSKEEEGGSSREELALALRGSGGASTSGENMAVLEGRRRDDGGGAPTIWDDGDAEQREWEEEAEAQDEEEELLQRFAVCGRFRLRCGRASSSSGKGAFFLRPCCAARSVSLEKFEDFGCDRPFPFEGCNSALSFSSSSSSCWDVRRLSFCEFVGFLFRFFCSSSTTRVASSFSCTTLTQNNRSLP